MPLSTVTVTGGASGWTNPDGTVPGGTVTFQPVQSLTGGGYILAAEPVVASLANGNISKQLANNSQIASLQYLVTEQITGATNPAPYVVTPTGTALDLSTAPRGTVSATNPLYVQASTLAQPSGVATLDGTGKVQAAQLPAGVATVAATDATIIIGGTATNPSVGVGAIAESKVTNLPADLAAKLPLAGGTLTGDLTMNGKPVNLLQSGGRNYKISAELAGGGQRLVFANTNAADYAFYWFDSTGGKTGFSFAETGTERAYLGTDAGAVVLESKDTFDLKFRTDSGAERLRLQAGSGNVGVGTANPSSRLQVAGPISTSYIAVTTTYAVTGTDSVVEATSGTFTVTLPSAAGITGRAYTIKNSGTGTITVATTSAQTIDGATTKSLNVQYGVLKVVSNGANWIVV